MDKIINDDLLDLFGGFDDEIDCAIIRDDNMESSLKELHNDDSDFDLLDPNINYTNDIHSADIVDMDADDYIAADRDINANPFEDDDLLEAANCYCDDFDYLEE